MGGVRRSVSEAMHGRWKRRRLIGRWKRRRLIACFDQSMRADSSHAPSVRGLFRAEDEEAVAVLDMAGCSCLFVCFVGCLD